MESGTEVLDSQMRGKRRLAYPIAKHKEGIYVQLSHKGNGQQVALLERAMRLSEDVIRYLTVKQDGPLPKPKSNSKDDEIEKSEKEKKQIKPNEDNDKAEAATESPTKDQKQEDSKD